MFRPKSPNDVTDDITPSNSSPTNCVMYSTFFTSFESLSAFCAFRSMSDDIIATSFDSLFSYNEPMYKLINQFEEPLRRLKDEWVL